MKNTVKLIKRGICSTIVSRIFAMIIIASIGLNYPGYIYCEEGYGDTKKIAITFDDGPHKEYTPKILDILKKHDVRGTFFIIGTNADQYPEIVKRTVSEGHEIGSHTYYHRHISAMDENELKEDLEKNEQSLLALTGEKPTLFRPPEGVCNDKVKNTAKEMGYSIIMWTVDTSDWQGIDSARIVGTVKKKVNPGAIILFHDYVSGRSGTPEALEKLIPFLKSEGYTFVTVSELLKSDPERDYTVIME